MFSLPLEALNQDKLDGVGLIRVIFWGSKACDLFKSIKEHILEQKYLLIIFF